MWGGDIGAELGRSFGQIALLVAIFTAVISCVLFSWIEGFLMVVSEWGPRRQSFTDAVTVNVLSTIVGAGFLAAFSAKPLLTSFVPVLLITWLWSVLLKSGVLLLRRRHSARQTLLTTLGVNTASYAVWGVLFAIGFSPELF